MCILLPESELSLKLLQWPLEASVLRITQFKTAWKNEHLDFRALQVVWWCYTRKMVHLWTQIRVRQDKIYKSIWAIFLEINQVLNTLNNITLYITLALVHTQASGQLLVPLGAWGSSVVAGQQAVSRQSEALVADILDGWTCIEMGTWKHPPAVLHLPRVSTRHHWMDRERKKSCWILY